MKKLMVIAAAFMVAAASQAATVYWSATNVYAGNATDKASGIAYFMVSDTAYTTLTAGGLDVAGVTSAIGSAYSLPLSQPLSAPLMVIRPRQQVRTLRPLRVFRIRRWAWLTERPIWHTSLSLMPRRLPTQRSTISQIRNPSTPLAVIRVHKCPSSRRRLPRRTLRIGMPLKRSLNRPLVSSCSSAWPAWRSAVVAPNCAYLTRKV